MIKLSIHLFFILFFSSCQYEVPTSHSDDNSLYGGNLIGSAEFKAAFRVIQKKCINCHSNTHNEWASFTNEEQWKIPTLVTTPGSPSASILYKRLKLTGLSPGNMPPDGYSWTAEERDTIKTWIEAATAIMPSSLASEAIEDDYYYYEND